MKVFQREKKTFCSKLVKKIDLLKIKSIFKKIFLGLNIIFAAVLLLSIFVKYLSASSISFLSVFSLTVPFFVFGNGAFFLFWLLKKNRKALISGLALLLGFFFLGPLYQFGPEEKETPADGIKIMTFNVRDFNELSQLNRQNVDSLIVDFIETEDPDIVCMQEAPHYLKSHLSNVLNNYDHKFIDYVYGEPLDRVIQAIYSKHSILKNQIIDFPKSYNSAIYTDVLVNSDTLRLFNLHLQSFNIVPKVSTIQKEESKKLFGRLQNAFVKQQQQAEIIKEYLDATTLPKIVLGDFNNTQFSNIYQTIKGTMSDTFLEKGNGFGRTYSLFKYPMRIDYIFVDENFEVLAHKNYDDKLSDHYPVMATVRLNSEE